MDRTFVEYSEARDLIRDGDALLFRNTGLVSSLIQIAGRSEYNHIGMAAWWDGDLMILETKRTGGQASLLSSQVEKFSGEIDVYRITDSTVITRKAVRAMRRVTGRRYGWLNILRISLTRLPILRIFFRPDTDDLSVSKAPPVCSHAVAWAYRYSGVDLVPNLSDAATEPGDIARSGILEYQFTLIPDKEASD